jgi:hypothetical protein
MKQELDFGVREEIWSTTLQAATKDMNRREFMHGVFGACELGKVTHHTQTACAQRLRARHTCPGNGSGAHDMSISLSYGKGHKQS